MEYPFYFGSIQIIKYLRINGIELDSNLWEFAIHSNNPEIIHFLEENHIERDKNELFKVSIKCHHNYIANYFLNNFLNDDKSCFL